MTTVRSLRTLAAPVVLLTMIAGVAATQTDHKHAVEAEGRVEVLSDFHDVIFQIWHTAWPEGNIGMLVDLLPQVRHYADTLERFQLPGILRDKKQAWDKGLASLRDIVTDYKAAAAKVDSAGLLDAAERLHAQYEKLVRTIRPVMKELDEFHRVLYMLYHHYWPKRDLEKLAPTVAALKEKMAVLEKTKLPGRWKTMEADFNQARAKLAGAVAALDASAAESNPDDFSSGLEPVHSAYQELERLFE